MRKCRWLKHEWSSLLHPSPRERSERRGGWRAKRAGWGGFPPRKQKIQAAPPPPPTPPPHPRRGGGGEPRGQCILSRNRRGVTMWAASVLTIFPEMFPGPLGLSLAGRALASGLWSLEPVDIRDYATDRHRSVDDTPAGGGPGLVMEAGVPARAIEAAGSGRPRLLMSPRGVPLTQARAAELAAGSGVV